MKTWRKSGSSAGEKQAAKSSGSGNEIGVSWRKSWRQ